MTEAHGVGGSTPSVPILRSLSLAILTCSKLTSSSFSPKGKILIQKSILLSVNNEHFKIKSLIYS